MLSFEQGSSLRERKQAKTKVFLAKDFSKSLKKAKYEDISIKSICEKAEVSEGTFYNYFPQKTDIFNYIVSLYHQKILIETDKKVSKEDPIKWSEVYFDNIVNMIISLGDLSSEVFANVIKERAKPKKINTSILEFMYMFPEMKCEGMIKKITLERSHEECLDEIAEKAIAKGLSKENITSKDVATFLKSILSGISFMRILYKDEEIKGIVRKQLSIFWDGIAK